MSKHWKGLKKPFLNVDKGTGCELESCYRTFNNLVSNSEYSKSNTVKKLSVLASVLSFLDKICVMDVARGVTRPKIGITLLRD